MEFKKNQIVELYIDDIGNEGEGIGHIDGYALFLKDAVIGDKVRAKIIKTKKNYGFARVEEVIEASKDRVSPRCSKARQCGGCTLQHLAYEKQLEYKFNKVKNCLERIGGLENIEEKMEPILGMEEPFYYRNKAQFPVGYDKEGNLITGFYAGRTHHIIDCTHCMIQHPVNEQILLKVLDYMKKNNITAYDEKTHKGLVRHIVTRVGFKTGEIMVCLVVNGSKKNLLLVCRTSRSFCGRCFNRSSSVCLRCSSTYGQVIRVGLLFLLCLFHNDILCFRRRSRNDIRSSNAHHNHKCS